MAMIDKNENIKAMKEALMKITSTSIGEEGEVHDFKASD